MTSIALISDIHFGQFSRTAEFSVPGEGIKDESTGGESLKTSMISVLKEKDVKYLCVAGDLTSLGSPQEFIYCEKMILDIAKELGISTENVFLGLGNHDIDWKISELYNAFNTANPEFPRDLVEEKYRKIAASASLINIDIAPSFTVNGPAPFSGIVENEDFVLFVLNTGWCCTQSQAISCGKLDSDQLKWFEDEAIKHKSVNKWKIVLMHHHPFNYTYPVQGPDFSTLEEGSKFLEIAGRNGLHLVLHGHRHHPHAETNLKSDWDGPITFVCAGSFAANSSHRNAGFIPNTLHLLELTDEIGVVRLFNYQYSPVEGWIPITKNLPETPIDSKMLLGKFFDSSEIEESIQKLANEDRIWQWDELEDCLRFMTFDKLNEKIRKQLECSHNVIGHFPEEVVLLKK